MKIFQIIKLLLLIDLAIAKSSNLVESLIEPDFVECYWCNSRDIYCGKRVTDTMVTTIKCPKHSKCAVYTNPYDNYYLHRGCTYGMDLGEVEIENGCFVEEDGSTYCFCDFNRCNAAGILDLRNLIDDKNETFKPFKSLIKNTRQNSQFQSSILKSKDLPQSNYQTYQRVSASGNQNYSSSKLASYFTIPPLYPTPSKLRSFQLNATSTKFESNDPNETLDRILVNLFGTSKSANSNLIKERIRNSSNPDKLIKKFEKYTMALLQNQQRNQNLNRFNYAVKNQSNINFINTTPSTTTTQKPLTKLNSTLSVVSFTQYRNEYEKINATFYKFTLPTTTTMASHVNPNSNIMMPSLYKLNINDSFSKNLIENKELRSRFGLKPKEKLNLLLLKKPTTEDGEQDIELLINNQNLNNDSERETITTKTVLSTQPTTTDSTIPTFIMSNYSSTTPNVTFSSTSTSITSRKSSENTTSSATTTKTLENIVLTSRKIDNLWLAKLRAKLSTPQSTYLQQEQELPLEQQRFQKYPKTEITDTYKWSYVLSDKYRQGVDQVNFKCPRDGLFANPINCAQFLQCVYFGTIYERFYILNCPAGLYFNTVLEMCDYPSNVNCPI